MARTTVDDCIAHCPNHFELVVGAVDRAAALRRGEPSDLAHENDREIVHALREIASGKHRVDLEEKIRQSLADDESLTSGVRTISPDSEAE